MWCCHVLKIGEVFSMILLMGEIMHHLIGSWSCLSLYLRRFFYASQLVLPPDFWSINHSSPQAPPTAKKPGWQFFLRASVWPTGPTWPTDPEKTWGFPNNSIATYLRVSLGGFGPMKNFWWKPKFHGNSLLERFIAFGDSYNFNLLGPQMYLGHPNSQPPISSAQKQWALRNQRWTHFEDHLLRSVAGYHGNLMTHMWNNPPSS